MGALFDMKAFFIWLETASEIELIKKRDVLADALQTKFTEDGVIADAKHLLKEIEKQLLSRAMK